MLIQIQKAEEILENLKADGRFEGKLWIKEADGRTICRIYVGQYGYIAVGQDGETYINLSRYRGNIRQAAGL